MRSSLWVGVGLAFVALASPGLAKPKPEKAGKAAKRVTKSLTKLKSYKVDFKVVGGTAQGADHKPVQTRVNHSWSEKVRGKVDSINGEAAFRLRRGGEGGAIQEGPNWKALLATEKGRMISRLFKRPETHLMEALRHKKRAKWGPVSEEANAKAALEAPKAEEAAGDGTRTKKKSGKKTKSTSDAAPLSHVITIEAPPMEAVRSFNRIVTSGCFSEG
jgi:hypothetical protein